MPDLAIMEAVRAIDDKLVFQFVSYGTGALTLSEFGHSVVDLGLPDDNPFFETRLFLGHLLETAAVSNRVVLFYLDAHWNGDLPVLEELALIFKHRAQGLVMIDDFQVPFDPGYGFDDYGHGKKLCIEILYPYREHLNKAYFPADPASTETGKRRGAVVCPLTGALDDVLCNMPSLRSVRL
jgi:hypothetical protein